MSGPIRSILGPTLARLTRNLEQGRAVVVFEPDNDETDGSNLDESKIAVIEAVSARRKIRSCVTIIEREWAKWQELATKNAAEKTRLEEWVAEPEHDIVTLIGEAEDVLDELQKHGDRANVYVSGFERNLAATQRALVALSVPAVEPSVSAPPPAAVATCRISLPQLKPPVFDGNCLEWSQFWQLFSAMVDAQPLDPVQKLSYLLTLLKGEARRLVDGYLIEAENYEIIKSLLIRRYGKREIIEEKLMNELMTLSRPTESAHKLREFLENLDRIRRQLANHGTHLDSSLTAMEVQKKLPHRVLEELVRVRGSRGTWNLEMLCAELAKIVEIREEVGRLEELKFATEPKGKSYNGPRVLMTNSDSSKCIFCGQNGHKSADCKKISDFNERKEMVRRQGRCFRCLSVEHRCSECQVTCAHCRGAHHEAICFARMRGGKSHSTFKPNGGNGNPRPVLTGGNQQPIFGRKTVGVSHVPEDVQNESVDGNSEERARSYTSRISHSVLPITFVKVQNLESGKTAEVPALIDSGSNESYVTADLMKDLELKSQKVRTIEAEIFGGSTTEVMVGHQVEIGLFTNSKKIKLGAIAVPKLMSEITISRFENGKVRNGREEPQLLIGRHHVWSILKIPQKQTSDGYTYVETELGRVVTGKNSDTDRVVCSYLANTKESVNEAESREEMISNFWELENLGINANELDQTLDESIRQKFVETTTFDPQTQQYSVDWLWKSEAGKLPTNFELAFQRTRSTLERVNRNPRKLAEYRQDFESQRTRGTIEPVTWKGLQGVEHYLPHRGVWTPNKSTTKLRTVFDASARVKGGLSLNQVLHKGPPGIPLLVGILLRFRLGSIGVVSDIEKMFHQVRLHQDQRDCVRFLLPSDWSKPIAYENLQVWRFTAVCFGVVCSPTLLSLVVEKHLSGEKQTIENMYVDNLVRTYGNSDEAIEDSNRLKVKLQGAHFNLREFFSNNEEIMRVMNPEESSRKTKVLGLEWDLKADTLKIQIPEWTGGATKRKVLSYMASMFDPCGLLSPLTIQWKVFQQKLWLAEYEWDAPLSESDHEIWEKLIIPPDSFWFPRQLNSLDENRPVDLIVFCDASETAYGAIAYLLSNSETPAATPVFAKSKIAPVRGNFTIPRGELMAVLIGVRMARFLEKEIETIANVVILTDSEIVLGQIGNRKEKQCIFVQRRLEEIREFGSRAEFRHVRTDQNPADIISRGSSLRELRKSELWWKGPEFLRAPRSEWPSSVILARQEKQEHEPENVQVQTLVSTLKNEKTEYEFVNPSRLKWSKLIRAGLKVLDVADRFKKRTTREDQWDRVQKVTRLLISEAQHKYPPGKKKEVKLRMFNDEHGLIRCRTRLPESVVGYSLANPIWLPDRSETVDRLIEHTHEQLCHGGTQAVLSSLRSSYWVPAQAVKRVLNACVRCRHFTGRPFYAPQSDLPAERVTIGRPFESTGVDLLGPVQLTDEQVYVALFTCLKVRAIHLEVLADTTTNQFVLAFDRFVARRGLPRRMLSDNATNFVLAAKCFNDRFGQDGSKWEHIVPAAPWRGGIWERLVRSVKDAVRKCQGRKRLNRWEFQTLIVRVEATLNSRPLFALNADDFVALKPSDFLCPGGNPHVEDPLEDTSVLQDPDFTEEKGVRIALKKRFNEDRARLDRFWDQWITDYLATLWEKNKLERNAFVQREPKVGELVLMGDDQVPRGQWKLARIANVTRDKQGKIRTAEIRLPSGKTLKRAINLLYPLELESEGEASDSPRVAKEPSSGEASGVVNPPRKRPSRKAKQRCKERLASIAEAEEEEAES